MLAVDTPDTTSLPRTAPLQKATEAPEAAAAMAAAMAAARHHHGGAEHGGGGLQSLQTPQSLRRTRIKIKIQ